MDYRKMYKYGIVVIGYKNETGMSRLLNALSVADYGDHNVLLIISIDTSDNDVIEKLANQFRWEYGDKEVITFPERLGLRNHVLHCGDYLNKYNLDALVVFEDDILPAQGFFYFVIATTEKYIGNSDIAGVSLYAHHLNFNTGQPFLPIMENYDNYFLQCAQSWGQVWFRNQWNDFRKWYQEQDEMTESYLLPANVVAWPETSWLKYHIKYCIENNKYFVYPYTSYSTCFSDIGEHTKTSTSKYQVPIMHGKPQRFCLMEMNHEAIIYDGFFENCNLYKYCYVDRDDILVDLYGDHIVATRRYLLTLKRLPYKIINSWGNRMVPHEMNIICKIPGDDIFLYDLGENSEPVSIPAGKRKRSKMRTYFEILDQWMCKEETGYRVQDYFLNKKWNHIAIYGKGKMGMHLYNRLKETPVCVEYFIDRIAEDSDECVYTIDSLEESLAVDAVVVTPILEFEQIQKCLCDKKMKNIVSLEDILA